MASLAGGSLPASRYAPLDVAQMQQQVRAYAGPPTTYAADLHQHNMGGKGRGKGGKGAKGGKGGKAVYQQMTPTPFGKGFKGGSKGASKSGKTGKKPSMNPKAAALADICCLMVEKYELLKFDTLLDLSGFSELEEMKSHSPNFNGDLWASVLKLVIEKKPTVTAISLERNKIKIISALANRLGELSSSMPNFLLESISLRDNSIESIKEITQLSKLGLNHLLMEGNPIYKCNSELLLKALKQAIPTLSRIDSLPLDRTMKMDVNVRNLGLQPDTDPLHEKIMSFMGNYFGCANQGRVALDQLMESYDAKATFTLTTGDKFDLGVAGTKFVSNLYKHNHDILRVVDNKRYSRGRPEVRKALEVLQEQTSEVDSNVWKTTEVSMVNQQLLQSTRLDTVLVTVTMHGALTFQLTSPTNRANKLAMKRYFDRTWILVPSGADGQPRIVNDMLHLRNPKNAESPVFTPEKLSGQIYSPHMHQQDDKVIKLCVETKLLPEHSTALLGREDVGWSLERAFNEYQKSMQAGALQPQHFNQNTTLESVTVHIFMQLTRLTEDVARACICHDQVRLNLLLGWKLFLEKKPDLRPEHFQQQ